jgi:hypothetical protein
MLIQLHFPVFSNWLKPAREWSRAHSHPIDASQNGFMLSCFRFYRRSQLANSPSGPRDPSPDQ